MSARPSNQDAPITLLQVVLACVIVALGVGVVVLFKLNRPEPARQENETHGLLVKTQRVTAGTHTVHLSAQGQVTAAHRVVLFPQVAGKITWVSDDLMPGGYVAKNARLLRLDGRDYQLALQSRSADVNRASLELQLEQRRQSVAQREWESFEGSETTGAPSSSEDGRSFALRQPQVETAEVVVDAARSAVQQARLNLQRTTVSAPFNAMVLTEAVDVGQYVAPGAQLATLVGTDEAWVQVSVPVESLSTIQVPAIDDAPDTRGAEVRVSFEVGGKNVERTGYVLRLLPDLDPSGGMARILVSIPDPFALEREDGVTHRMPMLLGSYVSVDIAVPDLQNVVEVPRLAVQEGNRAYVMNAKDELEVRELRVVWGTDETVLVDQGLSDGERVITSRVPSPVEGLALREQGANAPVDRRADQHEDSGASSNSDEQPNEAAPTRTAEATP